MPLHHHTNNSFTSNPNFDEHRWIVNIRRTLEEEIEIDYEIPVCIFNVPKPLIASDPDSYTPQQVAIGPYHHWRPEVHEMERYKLAAAKRARKQQLQTLKFQHIVDHLISLEPEIRACYHKFLDFSSETLAWMMAIDASFLLEFLQIFAIKGGATTSINRVSSRMSHLVDYAGRKSSHNAILRDMVMLENQIPLFVLRKMLEVQFSSLDLADEMLFLMVMGFCKELSPFKMNKEERNDQDQKMTNDIAKSAHLLDYLYDLIVPVLETPAIEDDGDQNDIEMEESKENSPSSTYIKDILNKIWKLISSLTTRLLLSIPFKLIRNVPWTILSNLPVFSILKQPLQYMFFPQDKEQEIKPNAKNEPNNPPLVEEITIPCVTELHYSGVLFLPTKDNNNILRVTFDPKKATFYLPCVTLDGNSEVVMRNLVAYEALNASGPLVFTRYTELMNGIIDTEEDVRLLREKGIVRNRMKSDEEVAKLWNGMSKSIRLTKVPFLDIVIEDVNNYYNGRWKVKIEKFMRNYVFGSWQLLTLLAAIFLLLLMTLQAFCSIYRYNHRLIQSRTNSYYKKQHYLDNLNG